eukprot:TRINITY_DN11816_c0_g1_i1.p1 TRINITY_DN11816_c0_g1~~TRINITY_DN11816_c0_g1_i1.p1  ORF type:complete len:439 (-),score=62.94 TRINITY_DN11816_c0_g1_i1:10-1152(-)
MDKVPGPYWVPDNTRVSLKQYIKKYIDKLKTESIDKDTGDYKDEVYKKYDRRVMRLKWLYDATMGCHGTFEARRKELSVLRNVSVESITDDDVVQDVYHSVSSPDGFVRQYLEVAQIGVCLGNTMFVHGGVDSKSIGFLPDIDNKDDVQEVKGQELIDTHTVQQWIEILNDWAKKSIEEWKKFPKWDSTRSKRGGSPVMGYGYKLTMKGRTIMVIDFMSSGQPAHLDKTVCNYLLKSGIQRVVAGHRPFGDSPTIIKSNGVEVIDGDTSYSDMSKPDNRGCAVGEICIQGSLSKNCTYIHGVLKTGQEYEFYLDNDGSHVESDPFIGREIPPGWWVKAKLKNTPEDGKQYLVSRGQGHDVHYQYFSAKELSDFVSQNIVA